MSAPMTPERLAEIRAWLAWEYRSSFGERGEQVAAELLAEVDRLTGLLGSHADGHRCTCTMTDPGIRHGDNAHPPEWEQDPWCLTHPDMDVILAEVARLRAQVAVAESFTAERPAYIQAIKASPHADADYWRWQGHAESRRHLSERLAALDSDGLGLWTVPNHLTGDLT